jgi:hypothetical protein
VNSIPLADAALFAPEARRTLLVRAVLVALLAASILAAALGGRDPRSQTIVTLPSHADTIVVLDVSASIASDTYSRIGATLSSLAASRGRYGLVVFSDQAYEALPPGSPAADLAPLVRYFVLPKQTKPGLAPTYPPNPWTSAFTAGTQISSGLELAHALATRNGVDRPAVLLVSDLNDDPGDLARLASIVLAYQRDAIPLRVVGLNPSTQDATLFKRLLGSGNPIAQAGVLANDRPTRNRTPFPWSLVAFVLTAGMALAAHELWMPRLTWEPAR